MMIVASGVKNRKHHAGTTQLHVVDHISECVSQTVCKLWMAKKYHPDRKPLVVGPSAILESSDEAGRTRVLRVGLQSSV